MTQEEHLANDSSGDASDDSKESEAEPKPPLNRAERRALAKGKAGASTGPTIVQQVNSRGAQARNSGVAGSGRIQSRGASRGK